MESLQTRDSFSEAFIRLTTRRVQTEDVLGRGGSSRDAIGRDVKKVGNGNHSHLGFPKSPGVALFVKHCSNDGLNTSYREGFSYR